jgi:hypothetical protein
LAIFGFVSACFLRLCLRSFFWLFAELESALDESAKALAGAVEQREANHAAMSEAVSDFCRVLGSGDVPSGSSPQSRLQVLGDHVRGRLHEALHHGVRRAFTVLASHYVVDLERVSEGYCLPDEDEAALAEVQRLDAAAAGPSAVLARLLPGATPNSVCAVSIGCTCVFLRPLRPEHFVTVA